MPGIKKDLTNRQFGKLLVKSFAGSNSRGQAQWNCKCECGKKTVVLGYNLSNGHTTSCGCNVTKHGMRYSDEYFAWQAMINRCYCKTSGAYPLYGGQGIGVCDRWREFKLFFEDMGPCPEGKKSIDRPNNDLGYGPNNARWASLWDQQRNRRSVKLDTVDIIQIRWLVIDGGRTSAEVAKAFGISSGHISNIINNKVWKEDTLDK